MSHPAVKLDVIDANLPTMSARSNRPERAADLNPPNDYDEQWLVSHLGGRRENVTKRPKRTPHAIGLAA
jgi:hypothetical protein